MVDSSSVLIISALFQKQDTSENVFKNQIHHISFTLMGKQKNVHVFKREIMESLENVLLRDGDATVEELKEKYADVLHPPGVDLVFNFQK